MLTYGRWYKPASGLLELPKIKVTYAIKDITKEKNNAFLSCLIFISVKKYIIINKIKEFINWFKFVKKFKKRDKKDINTIPYNPFSIKSFPSLSFKNFKLTTNPIDINVNAHR